MNKYRIECDGIHDLWNIYLGRQWVTAVLSYDDAVDIVRKNEEDDVFLAELREKAR